MKFFSIYHPESKGFFRDYSRGLRSLQRTFDAFDEDPLSMFHPKFGRSWFRLSDVTNAMNMLKARPDLREWLLNNCIVLEVIVKERGERGMKATVIELEMKRFIK